MSDPEQFRKDTAANQPDASDSIPENTEITALNQDDAQSPPRLVSADEIEVVAKALRREADKNVYNAFDAVRSLYRVLGRAVDNAEAKNVKGEALFTKPDVIKGLLVGDGKDTRVHLQNLKEAFTSQDLSWLRGYGKSIERLAKAVLDNYLHERSDGDADS